MAKPPNTKQLILDICIDLFSTDSYTTISIRDIAKKVGIKPASIYNHYKSKEAILSEIYDFFCDVQNSVLPSLDALLLLAETAPPKEVLMKCLFYYPPELQETMDRIIVIASLQRRTDSKSAEFLKRCLFDLPLSYIKPLLERMLELKRIKPFDIDSFLVLYSNFCFGAAVRNHSMYPLTIEEWHKGSEFLFGLVVPADDTSTEPTL